MEQGSSGECGQAVVVAGDAIVEWCLAARGGGLASVGAQPGGAALLASLLTAASMPAGTGGPGLSVTGPARLEGWPGPTDPSVTRSFSVWAELPRGPGQDPARCWRVREAVGLDRGAASAPVLAPPQTPPALLVIDDAALGFRDRPETWSPLLEASGPDCPVLVRIAWPVGEGPLFAALIEHADRVVALVELDDLRRSDVELSRELSWERTAQDLFWELVHNPRINSLARFAHVVVSIGTAGAVVLSGGSSPGARCTLVFDPEVIEGEWEERHPGTVIGSEACMVAGVALALLADPGHPDLVHAIRGGLSGRRRLHLDGWTERAGADGAPVLAFPADGVAAALRDADGPFVGVPVDDPAHRLPARGDEQDTGPGFWTILADRYPGELAEVARQLAVEGTGPALDGVPLGRFGALLTVDRHEIEALRSVRSLIREYRRQGRQKRPLSVAVFGPPGSGKSFGVVQIANAVLPGEVEVLEFNVSQWRSGQDLVDALHRVRDAGLGGRLPLVFWDEFDAAREGEPLGWLRAFLGPMQDGRFQEGQVTHPIGPSIFVFAGGQPRGSTRSATTSTRRRSGRRRAPTS